MKTTPALFALAVLSLASMSARSQTGGYYISRINTIPDEEVATQAFEVPVSSNREDVKAIGMGKTQFANGTQCNAMMYNPALLANDQTRLDVPGVQASLPAGSYRAIDFLRTHISEFKTGNFIKLIKSGLADLKSAGNQEQALAALREIQSGLRFPNELQENVGGTLNDPQIHGISLIPAIQLQFGNFGLSLYGVAQSAFQLQSGTAVSALSRIKLPENVSQLTPLEYIQLAAAVEPLIDENGNLREDALPEAYAVSYMDVVGAFGYGAPVSDRIDIGATVKVINRRFSSKRIAADYFEDILGELRKDFNTSVTSATIDIGGLYKFPGGTRIGVSALNLLPVKTVTSKVTMNLVQSGIQDYDRDQHGNYIINQNGDTALVAAQGKLRVTVPVELKEPVLLNVGVMHPLTDNWDVSLDIADAASQDEKFNSYLERIRLGTEVRFDALKDKLGLVLRGGFADKHFTFGVGLNLFRVLQIDGAYAYDTYFGENSYFGQVKLGW